MTTAMYVGIDIINPGSYSYSNPLTKLMEGAMHHHEAIKVPSLHCIKNIAIKSADGVSLLVENGILSPFITAIQFEMDPLIRAEIWWILSNIVSTTTTRKQGDNWQIIETLLDPTNGIINALFNCLKIDRLDVSEEAFGAFENIINNASEIQLSSLFLEWNILEKLFLYICQITKNIYCSLDMNSASEMLIAVISLTHKILMIIGDWKSKYNYQYYVDKMVIFEMLWKWSPQKQFKMKTLKNN